MLSRKRLLIFVLAVFLILTVVSGCGEFDYIFDYFDIDITDTSEINLSELQETAHTDDYDYIDNPDVFENTDIPKTQSRLSYNRNKLLN